MNKKGIAEPIVDIFMFFAVMLLFVVFGAVFSFMTGSHVFKLDENKEEIDSKVQLLQLMRTPVEIDGYNTDYAGLIALGYYDKELQGLLKDKLDTTIAGLVRKTNISAARLIISDYEKGLTGRGQMVITKGSINQNVDAPSNSYESKKFGISVITLPGFKENIKVSLIIKNEE